MKLRKDHYCRREYRYLGGFHEMVEAHDSVSTFANFGDGVCEWTFQRDKLQYAPHPPAL